MLVGKYKDGLYKARLPDGTSYPVVLKTISATTQLVFTINGKLDWMLSNMEEGVRYVPFLAVDEMWRYGGETLIVEADVFRDMELVIDTLERWQRPDKEEYEAYRDAINRLGTWMRRTNREKDIENKKKDDRRMVNRVYTEEGEEYL